MELDCTHDILKFYDLGSGDVFNLDYDFISGTSNRKRHCDNVSRVRLYYQ